MNVVFKVGGLLLAITVCGFASAADYPKRKAGLWEISMDMPGHGKSPGDVRMCIDAETDARMFEMGTSTMKELCSRQEVTRNGNVMTSDSICKMGESRMTSHAVTTFTGDYAYHIDSHTSFDPPMMGQKESVMAQDAKWTGACPADMQPGDIAMPNGMKTNIKAMPGAHEKRS